MLHTWLAKCSIIYKLTYVSNLFRVCATRMTAADDHRQQKINELFAF